MGGDDTSKELCAPTAELVKLAREELGEMSARQRAEGYAKLNARRSPERNRARLALSLAAALAVAAVLFIGHRWLTRDHGVPLSYAIEGGRIEAGGTIEANGAAEPTLRFSDGTEVVFLAGARGRVRSVDEHGARIALTGKAKVEVVHWRGAHWLFDAGPFLITVKGTAFTAEWREADEQLEVVLKTGSVAVSGPLSDEAITLRAGQRLLISTREKEVVIRDLDAISETRAASSVAPRPWEGLDNAPPSPIEARPSEKPAHRPAPAATAASAAPSAPASATASNWTAELAAGHFATILRQAEQRGLETALAEMSSDDLAALADAARYSRREDVARRALAAQRRRFPQSARANDAAFLLGRLEETAGHPELALAWYERCLTEPRRGTYTSEALGRKMTVVQRLYGAARARPIADEYLRRFENGTYAAAARALTRAP
jgi:hypothetical protein